MSTSTKATWSRIAVAISDDQMQASIQLNQSSDKSPNVLSKIIDALDGAGVVRDDAVFQRAEQFVRLATTMRSYRNRLLSPKVNRPREKMRHSFGTPNSRRAARIGFPRYQWTSTRSAASSRLREEHTSNPLLRSYPPGEVGEAMIASPWDGPGPERRSSSPT